ncbi:Uncharacterised protein [BD1-7 clade bacterium]|nr:Uncharacterised protein [BD1-7 clade bacterium]
MSAEPLSRREKNRLNMRGRIKKAATLLFVDQSIEATSVTEIANAADIAEKTFYNHYPTKRDLLSDMSDEMIRLCNRLVEDAANNASDFDTAVNRAYQNLADEMTAYPALAKGLVNFVMSQSTHDQLPAETMTFMPVLEVGRKHQSLSDQFDIAFLDRMLTGTHYNVTLHWTNNPNDNLQQQMEHAAAFLLQSAKKR